MFATHTSARVQMESNWEIFKQYKATWILNISMAAGLLGLTILACIVAFTEPRDPFIPPAAPILLLMSTCCMCIVFCIQPSLYPPCISIRDFRNDYRPFTIREYICAVCVIIATASLVAFVAILETTITTDTGQTALHHMFYPPQDLINGTKYDSYYAANDLHLTQILSFTTGPVLVYFVIGTIIIYCRNKRRNTMNSIP